MATKTSLTVNALKGDAKVLLAFNLGQEDIKNLAGFTIQCQPQGADAYYLLNKLAFENPRDHMQDKTQRADSTINAPIQKFRWLHVPGGLHTDGKIIYGKYTYTVTPRYFDDKNSLLAIDNSLSVTVKTTVEPFVKGGIELGFTRGFVQSQAFVDHFGPKAPFKPKDNELLFDTSEVAGTDGQGKEYTYLDEYTWSGLTARTKVFEILDMVQKDKTLFLDVFAYDLSEPDVMKTFIALGKKGRIRILLDNAALHLSGPDKKTGKIKVSPEDAFTKEFKKTAKKIGSKAPIIRGKFSRFQHNKVLIVSKGKNREPVKVLSGSTNFSVTGMYVNSNHVIIFNDPKITATYQGLFEEAWKDALATTKFQKSDFPLQPYDFKASGIPPVSITFAPHPQDQAEKNLDDIVTRMTAEKKNILFAVMGIDPKTTGPVAPALIQLHQRKDIFTCGITDSTNGITLYKVNSPEGLLVTGKQGATLLPPPFQKEASIGLGHQVHHKFIVCGFNTKDAVVWLGSSNLALGGEEENGDNLIQIKDNDIATAFALEALALVDHFHFRDSHMAPKAPKKGAKPVKKKAASPTKNPVTLNLHTDGAWAKSYYSKTDLHCLDRLQFA